MELEGFTNNTECALNNAILNVAKKLKIDIWTEGYITKQSMYDVPISDRIDLLISLSKKLYRY